MKNDMPKYKAGDILLDNGGRVIFQVIEFIENPSIIWQAKYLYKLKNLTDKRKDYDVISEKLLVNHTRKITSSAAYILFGINTALE